MAAFDYQAVDDRGKNKKGVLEGDNAKQVRSILRERGLIPIEVTPALAKAKQQAAGGAFGSKKISSSELALITRQMATLVESGLPLEETLVAVAEQCEKDKLKSMIMSVRSKVNEGFTLAESMAEFPNIFDNLFRAMVAAGEKSGHLDKVLNRLADYTEQRQNMRSQIIQASIYPIIMTLVAVSVIVVLLVAVVPQIVGQFDHLGEQLPGSTQVLIAVSDFLKNYVLWILAFIVLCMFGFRQMMKKAGFRMKVHEKSLSLPITGKVTKGLNTARFARTLSILTASSVPLLESMRIAGEVLTNDYIKLRVSEAADKVREGASLQASLKQTKLFPPMMVHMIASGEKSGELESMLERAADNQDRQFEALVSISLKIFEPALMVTMGTIVLFIVMAIVQPILQLNTMI
ncbi:MULTISPECIES: type II secretion system inner membrane protein GspF [unclassified Thalassotalea]|uniref:type II secretion system inner membrane protein GspF n=1 Tax=unclassified Thalassotalea TaxID=2614972 RepID=UPI00108065C9|nr:MULTISPECIES: type II secretion system inner membrane protein GspF [unclassified Thalassotalea]NMP17003.1 type II secretion system inner membrane protein GspF [Thalassotalea sp. Y01]QBY04637.1 type II secretion system protein GspF [Thalassotalea sp. HSM 43]